MDQELAGVAGFEPTNAGIKIPCLTAWRHPNIYWEASAFNLCGAGDKFRTCYLQSHNLALYRLSYARHKFFGAPGEIRTPDTRLRRPLLYPTELQAHKSSCAASLKILERVMGIEPTQPAWKASVLPLNYTRRLRA